MELGINTWLQIRHTPHEITLLEHRDAYRALSTYAPRMSENSPVLIAFIGYRSKAYMLDHIWGIERAGQDSHKSVRLYSDTTETPHSLPVVLLDCEIHNIKTAYRPESRIDGGEIVRRPLIWPDHHGPVINTEGIAFNLYARALAPLVNVFCLFAADLGGLKGIARRLVRWIALPAASDAPTAILPRLQVVVETASTSFDSKTMKNKLFSYMLDELRLAYGRADEEQLQCDLDRHFQHLSIMPVDKRQRQGAKLTLYHKLQSQLNAECADLQKVRKAQGFSFRAHHHQTYMSLLLDHFCATNLESFSFLQAARLHNPLSNSLQTHIQELLMLQRSEHFLTECFVILVAVALVLDSFPPGSHQFPPTMLFDRFYRDTCIAAISQYNGTAPKSVSLITLQIRAFNSLFENFKLYSKELTKSCMSVVQLHRNKVIGLQTQLQDLKSHTTCFNCLMRMPEKSLSCGHALCNHCIRVFGTPLKNKPFFYLLNRCLLCGKINKSGEFRYQPPTAGIRVLCIDGGGIRGIIPIVFLQSIEERLGLAIPIQDHFDQVVGTSAGGLVVLGLFLKKWTLEECKEKFEIFASKAFERRKMSTIPILSSMPNLVRTYFADSVYKTTAIEAAFQSAFAPSQGMFNPITSDINVAVTATTAGKTMQCIFTNYNGPMPPSQSSGYNLIRAQCPNDDVSIQDAARCTSAAPFFFQAKSLKSLGTFQDGGLLHHNNPVKLALWESKRLRGSDCSYDFVLSLGTGTSDSPAETKQYYPGSPVKDGFCSRLFRSYMASLDGEKTWIELINTLSEEAKSRFHRLNLSFTGSEPGLDDVAIISRLTTQARQCIRNDTRLIAVTDSILASLFYVELQTPGLLQYVDGPHQCYATIFCRLHDSTSSLNQLMRRLALTASKFHVAGRAVPCVESPIYPSDSTVAFRRPICFSIRSSNERLYISLSGITTRPTLISGLPRTIKELDRMQRLHMPLGGWNYQLEKFREKPLPSIPQKRKRGEFF